MTQKELASESGVSYATVQAIEQGTGAQPRVSTLLKLATALSVTTSSLMSPEQPEPPDAAPAERWDDVLAALYRPGPANGEATPAGVLAALASVMPGLADNRYAQVRPLLPALLRESASLGGGGRAARSRVLNTVAWLLTQTRQFGDAEAAARMARESAPDLPDEAAAVNTAAWALLRQGKLAEAAVLAEAWADEAEPRRFSRAPAADLAAWGKIQLYVANAAVRDGRPDTAADALSLARSAASRIGRETALDFSTTRTFGPASVAMIGVENAVLTGKPDRALTLAERVPSRGLLHAQSASRRRHRLDVAAAHAALRQYGDAVAGMQALRYEAPEWLAQQRFARDVLAEVIRRRRRLTPEMRELADAVRLPL
jgi:transcriptional regulator with XRE-family HTH domain